MADEEDPQKPHDVLAAEEFVVPAPDPLLQHEPVKVPGDPDDPEGQSPPHDVLAGEEFPIPAPPGRSGGGEATIEPSSDGGSRGRSRAKAGVIGAALVGIAAALRRRRRRST